MTGKDILVRIVLDENRNRSSPHCSTSVSPNCARTRSNSARSFVTHIPASPKAPKFFDGKNEKQPAAPIDPESDPFLEGHEDRTPPALLEVPRAGGDLVRDGWAGVRDERHGNRRLAWVRLDSPALRVRTTRWEITVDRSARTRPARSNSPSPRPRISGSPCARTDHRLSEPSSTLAVVMSMAGEGGLLWARLHDFDRLLAAAMKARK